jgi:hypothetical protein
VLHQQCELIGNPDLPHDLQARADSREVSYPAFDGACAVERNQSCLERAMTLRSSPILFDHLRLHFPAGGASGPPAKFVQHVQYPFRGLLDRENDLEFISVWICKAITTASPEKWGVLLAPSLLPVMIAPPSPGLRPQP